MLYLRRVALDWQKDRMDLGLTPLINLHMHEMQGRIKDAVALNHPRECSQDFLNPSSCINTRTCRKAGLIRNGWISYSIAFIRDA
jgi:hypothetical protein